MQTPSRRSSQAGFTLIELSIVLVIIGLIAGGVLVGQDLIRAAEIRSQIDQLDAYDAAVNTFRGKYNGLPGDLSTAANFGLANTNLLATARGRGNGNGLIESAGTTGLVGYMGENVIALTHLNQANLTKEGMLTVDYTAAITGIADTNMPPAKLGKGNRIYFTALNGLHFYFIAGFNGNTTATTAVFSAAPTDNMTPNEAFQIDTKLDDGIPNTGIVRPLTFAAAATVAGVAAAGEAGATDAGAATPAAGDCWDTDAPVRYATDTATTRDIVGCQLRIRASF
jgi:prepilin-type N-terminal cleavage/methylation domain-containing protein